MSTDSRTFVEGKTGLSPALSRNCWSATLADKPENLSMWSSIDPREKGRAWETAP